MSNPLGNNGGRSYDFQVQPVKISCNFVVQSADTLGQASLKGAGVEQVFMYSSAGGSATAAGNPLTVADVSPGYILVQLENNYERYVSGYGGFVSPITGSAINIASGDLTIGQPYIITSVGLPAKQAVTIAPHADSSGNLAGSWFNLFDSYGNNYVMWIYVTGVGGTPPVGVGGVPIQVTIAENATAANITTAISGVVLALSSAVQGVNLPLGVAPFTESGAGGATLTLTATNYSIIPGPPAAGVIAGTAWTFAQTVYNTNLACWQGCGLMPGVVPAVGASFVATSTGVSTGGASTGQVYAPGVSGIDSIEVIGDANQMIKPIPMGYSPNVGGWILMQCLLDGVLTQPADGTVIGLTFGMEAKSVLIKGQ